MIADIADTPASKPIENKEIDQSRQVEQLESARVASYRQFFTPTAKAIPAGDFIPQVHGYGTPVYSQVSSSTGL